MYKIISSVLFVVYSVSVQAENRFSMAVEYELMNECVGRNSVMKKIKRCACALEKTMEDGWNPDYDNDEDYFEDQEVFDKKFLQNTKLCRTQ